uniref:C2H2-type domain-containing protein n=1 Tax=viral metagenome TaxID=1070528 RepID=A0A6C0M5P5_9ZZZZ
MDKPIDKKVKYFCKPCQYSCNKKSHYVQHCETERHMQKSQSEATQVSELKEFMKNMMTMQNDIINVLVDKIKEKPTQVANVTTTNHTHNTIHNNTQFNVQVFLNTECKDAVKLSDFMKTLKITLQDLEFTKTNGIVEGVGSIIANNLKVMDVHKRPIHCTDAKRETMYIKSDEWIKDDMHEHVKKFIYMTSCYQTRVIQDWMEAHPGWETKEKMHMEYQSICKELYKNIEKDDAAHRKILKIIAKETHINKNDIMELMQ